MKRVALNAAAVASLLVIAATSFRPGGTAHAEPSIQIEPLYGFAGVFDGRDGVTEPSLSITVRSTGCTKVEDFVLEPRADGLILLRLRPDRCRKKPFLKTLILPFPDGGRSKALLNPLFLSLR